MANERWFEETKEQSDIKRIIVSKYFEAWAKVMIPRAKSRQGKIAYIDLFSGPGRYQDGTKSIPLIILETAIQNSDLCKMLVTIFNDVNFDNSSTLEKEINNIKDIDLLEHKPLIYNFEVGKDIVNKFESMSLVPSLFFVDPWGYKGLSLKLINSVLKDWGCDCIFFFNYNRINMGLMNPSVKDHMNALFGEERADKLRTELEALSNPLDKELTIIEKIVESINEMGGKYVIPFCFKNDRGTRTSHHLFFVSKNVLGYKIMKDIMAKASSQQNYGVATFSYCPADRKYPLLFEFSRPIDDLEKMLLSEFAGTTMSMISIFQQHNIGRPYTEKNYKDVLLKLEAKGLIEAEPPSTDRRKGTFGDDVKVTF